VLINVDRARVYIAARHNLNIQRPPLLILCEMTSNRKRLSREHIDVKAKICEIYFKAKNPR
jgi:hypothetical protein